MLRQQVKTIHVFFTALILGLLFPLSVYAETVCEKCAIQEQAVWNEKGVEHLIGRIGWAAEQQNFLGRYIISQRDSLVALQTAHFFANQVEYELITTLMGDKHQIYRKNEEYYGVNYQTQQVFFDPQSMAQLFPFWGKPGYGKADEYYTLSYLRKDYFLGRNTDVVRIEPKDKLRFGYQMWLDHETGLLLRLEVEDDSGSPLQRFSFTEIDLDAVTESQEEEIKNFIATLKAAQYQVYEWPFTHASPAAFGWHLVQLPVGFEQVIFITRPRFSAQEHEFLQWVFSDGVANVSIFIEHMIDEEEVNVASLQPSGATHGIVFPLGEWKVTLVGEVPERTLQAFALALEHDPIQFTENEDK